MRPQIAPPTSFTLACYKGFSEYHLTSAISSEAERGYPNILGNKMRFSNFLHLKLLHLCSRSNNTHTRTLLEDLSSYNTASSAERSKFLNKVSVLMGYTSIEHLVEQERVHRTSVSCGNGMLEEFDFTLARGRFPCIKFGDSSFVELYDEVPHQQERSSLLLPDGLNKYLPSSVDENWSKNIKPGEAWQVVGPPLIPFPSINSPLPIEEGSHFVVCDSQEADSAGEAKSNGKISGKKSATNLATKSVETKMPDEQILDKIIRCIPGTTSRQCRQLEDRGFHTVRKLLHHFPRTYADLQNAQGAIVDGQYLIFVGTVLSSRGIRANSTFAFLEVVVRTQFSNEKPVSGMIGDAYDIRDDRVYLHLKKYFRGIRFTFQPFLTRLQSKYQQGSHVVVSGKVNKMRQENHYEMKEYTIDNLEKDQPHAYAERRPYPLYPSKSGMDPSFLRDIISRAVKLLSTNIDPVPNEILQEFNLLSLCDITDIPPGRTPVATFVLEGNDKGFESVFQMMRDELTGGGKVYLVYPIIKESELLPQLRAATVDYQLVSEKFVGYQCGILHGRMTNEEKNDALRRFRSGETHILVSTQMIEVGLDVPDASMMVVMNAERFGFAQLHQLRGRVGRGERKSKCILLSSTSVTLERLKFLEESSDGFYLANVDLLLRGPGNLLGKKQSGHLPEFPIARLVEKDQKIPQEAHLAAVKVLSTSTDLESFPKLKAELSMRQPLCVLGD